MVEYVTISLTRRGYVASDTQTEDDMRRLSPAQRSQLIDMLSDRIDDMARRTVMGQATAAPWPEWNGNSPATMAKESVCGKCSRVGVVECFDSQCPMACGRVVKSREAREKEREAHNRGEQCKPFQERCRIPDGIGEMCTCDPPPLRVRII